MLPILEMIINTVGETCSLKIYPQKDSYVNFTVNDSFGNNLSNVYSLF